MHCSEQRAQHTLRSAVTGQARLAPRKLVPDKARDTVKTKAGGQLWAVSLTKVSQELLESLKLS